MDLGLPAPAALTMFGSDPEIKNESVWAGPVLRPAALLADRGASGAMRFRGAGADWGRLPCNLNHAFPGSSIEIAEAGSASN